MRTFKEGKLPVLIATDVASRGIDVDDVDCVINYDVPEENEYYIHRIGRTGRAKKKGIAVSILGTFPEAGEARGDRKIFALSDSACAVFRGRHAGRRSAEAEKAAAAPEVPPVRQTERGLMLLCLPLGDMLAGALSLAQARELSKRARAIGIGEDDPLREVTQKDVQRLGYSEAEAAHIVALLNRERRLNGYLLAAEKAGVTVVTRLDARFPQRLREQLGARCPAALFCRGDMSLLQSRCISCRRFAAVTSPGRSVCRAGGASCPQQGGLYALLGRRDGRGPDGAGGLPAKWRQRTGFPGDGAGLLPGARTRSVCRGGRL